jgi:hypothetical protein
MVLEEVPSFMLGLNDGGFSVVICYYDVDSVYVAGFLRLRLSVLCV